jgi:hypothetical protein
VQELRGTECFCMEIGCFFQFQRRLSRNGESGTSPNRNEAVRSSDARYQLAPIQFTGGDEAIGGTVTAFRAFVRTL